MGQVGGIGKKVRWKVSRSAVYENNIWAVRLAPRPAREKYYTPSKHPMVVLAVRRGTDPADAQKIKKWNPVSSGRALTFDTVVGEKAMLCVEEITHDGELESKLTDENKERHCQQECEEETIHQQSCQQVNGDTGPLPHSGPHYLEDASGRGNYRSRGRGKGSRGQGR